MKLVKNFSLICLVITSYYTQAQKWSYLGDPGTNNWLGTNDYSPLDIKTNSEHRLFISSSGRIGINTTSPTATFNIIGYTSDLTAGMLKVRFANNSGTALTNTEFSALTRPGPGVIGGNGFTALYAKCGNSTGTAAGYFDGKVIVNNGSVGIGTTSPIQVLDVNGRINVANGVIQRGGNPISNTNDLGLYSLENGYYIRFVTNNAPFKFFSDGGINSIGGEELLTIGADGNVGIGTTLVNNPNNYKLAVNGTIGAKAIKVEITTNTWPDFVFENKYYLMPIKDLAYFININKHLPETPSALEIEENGIDIGELLKLQMQKIEELTLYIINQDKRIESLENKLIDK